MDYNGYNREERDLCAHLFRLLLSDQSTWQPLTEFLCVKSVVNPRVFCEVALIRDAYHANRSEKERFVGSICELIATELGKSSYTKFCDLPEELRKPSETHPRQIYFKMRKQGFTLEDLSIYGALSSFFNAKPDLVVCEGSNLFAFEVEYTLNFDSEQLVRTKRIAEIWKNLLYRDLGFAAKPSVHVRKVGLEKHNPDISWEKIAGIARRHLREGDLTNIAFQRIEKMKAFEREGATAI